MTMTQQLRWTLRRWLPLLGWPGLVALGLLMLALLFYVVTLRPMQARLDTAHQATAAQELTHVSANLKQSTPDEQLEMFYQYFPAEKKSPEWLARLASLAEKNGVALNEGEYKTTQDNVGKLVRLGITLPVEGKYPQIRKFLATLNAEIPVIALQDVQFERESIDEVIVQARIKLVLFMVQDT